MRSRLQGQLYFLIKMRKQFFFYFKYSPLKKIKNLHTPLAQWKHQNNEHFVNILGIAKMREVRKSLLEAEPTHLSLFFTHRSLLPEENVLAALHGVTYIPEILWKQPCVCVHGIK